MSSSENLLPRPYFSPEKRSLGFLFVLPFPIVGWSVFGISLFSFIFCVVWSIVYDYEEANATHCSVENFLPSISAAIGSFYPQKYLWMLAISLVFYPRLFMFRMYSEYFNIVIDSRYSKISKLTIKFYVLENLFLLGLTYISSTTHYSAHAFCFVSFLVTSMFYMGFSCFLLKFRRKIPQSNLEAKTLKWKFQFYIINIICFLLAGYFFYRHNKYCEPGVYSAFALFEYGVVVSNMSFHALAIWDFFEKRIMITSGGIDFS